MPAYINRGYAGKHFHCAALFGNEDVNIIFDGIIVNGLLKNSVDIRLSNQIRKLRADQFRFDVVACQLFCHIIGIDNAAVQAKRNHGIMVIFFE
ncbi:hypothetical protein D3C73_881650 [compost metagenome]